MDELREFFESIMVIFASFFGFIKGIFGGTYPWDDESSDVEDGDGE